MSIIDLQRDLESFPDRALAQETQSPSGQYPLYLVAAEIQRRADLRERFARQQQMGQAVQPPVLQQRLAQMGLGAAPGPQMPGQMPGQGQNPAPMGGGMQSAPPMGGGMPQQARGFQTGGRVQRNPDDEIPQVPFRLPDRLPEMQRPAPRSVFDQMQREFEYLTRDVPSNFARMRDEAMARTRNRHLFESLPPGTSLPSNVHVPQGYMNPEVVQQTQSQVATHAPSGGDLIARGQALMGGPSPRDSFLAQMASMQEVLSGLPDEVMDQLESLGQNEEVIAEMQRTGQASEAEISGLQDRQRDMVEDFATSLEQQSAVEKALSAARRSPDELARERRNRAFAQLGSLIGGAVEVGDVATGLGRINESIYAQRMDQEQREQDISLALASAQDSRERERRQLLIEQGGQDVAAAIGSLERSTQMARSILQSRAINAQAAASLLSTLQRSVGLLASSGGGGLRADDLLKYMSELRQLRESLQTAQLEGMDPASQQSIGQQLFAIDNIISQILTDQRMPYQGQTIQEAAGALDRPFADAAARMRERTGGS